MTEPFLRQDAPTQVSIHPIVQVGPPMFAPRTRGFATWVSIAIATRPIALNPISKPGSEFALAEKRGEAPGTSSLPQPRIRPTLANVSSGETIPDRLPVGSVRGRPGIAVRPHQPDRSLVRRRAEVPLDQRWMALDQIARRRVIGGHQRKARLVALAKRPIAHDSTPGRRSFKAPSRPRVDGALRIADRDLG